MYCKEALMNLVREKSLKFGDFILASGKKAKYYLDGKQVTLDAAGACLVGEGILELLEADEIFPDAVGGMSIGTDPITAAVITVGAFYIGELRVPLVVIYFIVAALIVWVIWNKTKLGKNMFAVGGNTEAAAVSGVNVAKTIMLVYLMAGVLYGIASFLEAARITAVGANTGLNYETDAISAVVVGGVSFSGGVGTIQGVVIGAVIMQAIVYALQFLGVNPYIQYIIRGLIIILAVSIDVRKYIVKK